MLGAVSARPQPEGSQRLARRLQGTAAVGDGRGRRQHRERLWVHPGSGVVEEGREDSAVGVRRAGPSGLADDVGVVVGGVEGKLVVLVDQQPATTRLKSQRRRPVLAPERLRTRLMKTS